MATILHVTTWAGRKKYQADEILLDRMYISVDKNIVVLFKGYSLIDWLIDCMWVWDLTAPMNLGL